MAIQENCRIIDHQKIGPRHYLLTLSSAYIASHALPGQFVNIKCSKNNFPLLRRPISLHRIRSEHGSFELFYEVVGSGTLELSRANVGDEINILGPLGKGFNLPENRSIFMLVGGGMGSAPLLALAEAIKKAPSGKKAVYLFQGARQSSQLVLSADFEKICDKVMLSTDDGSRGARGLVSDLLVDFIENEIPPSLLSQCTIYGCGPRPMQRALVKIAQQKKIVCQISLEERMACGIGACKGCAVETVSGYKMVCSDGPVFAAEEIKW